MSNLLLSCLKLEIQDLVNQRLLIENSKIAKINNLIIRRGHGRDLLRIRRRKRVLVNHLSEILATYDYNIEPIMDPVNRLFRRPQFPNRNQLLTMLKIVIECLNALIKHKKHLVEKMKNKIAILPLRNQIDLDLIRSLNSKLNQLESEIFDFKNENFQYAIKYTEIYFS
jgi:hypothetical protein